MYLQYNLFDIVLMQVPKKKLFNIQSLDKSRYVFDQLKDLRTIDQWLKYSQYQTTLSQLHYQWNYSNDNTNYFMYEVRWNYLLGPMKYNVQIMNNAIICGDLGLILACLRYNITPNYETMVLAKCYNFTQLIHLCSRSQVIDSVDNMTDMFEDCVM